MNKLSTTLSKKGLSAIILLLLAIPVLLILVRQQTSTRSRAAAPDQLEAEGGVLGGNAVAKADSLASGGNYVLFGGFSITSGPTSQSITANSAEITWTLSENATGQIEYGTTISYGTLSTPENSFTYSTHVQTLSGLITGTTYHYRVKSTNQAGQQVVSGDNSFTTSEGGVTPTSGPTPTGVQTGYGPRPAPATPTGANVYTVPSNIDGTGATEVSSAINAWVASLPNGTATAPTILVFPSGKTYRMKAGIHLNGRQYLTFFGYGCKLNLIGSSVDFPTTQPLASGFLMGWGGAASTNIKILGFELAGANIQAGTHNASPWRQGYPSSESIQGIAIYGATSDLEIADNWIHNMYSDGIYVYAYNEPNTDSDRVNIHHNLIELTGRNAITYNEGSDWQIKWNHIRDTGTGFIDSEDARSTIFNIRRFYITDNLVERWFWDMDVALYLSTGGPAYGNPGGGVQGYYTDSAISVAYSDGQFGEIRDGYIERNTFRGGPMSLGSVDYGRCNTETSVISEGFTSYGSIMIPKFNINIRDNTIDYPTTLQCGSGIRLHRSTGTSITGNSLPGMTIGTTGSTGITISNNVSAGQPHGGAYPD